MDLVGIEIEVAVVERKAMLRRFGFEL